MPIPFPRMHIAESVINRIMNTMDELEPTPIPQSQPLPPQDPLALGQQIEEQTQQPTPEVELPPSEPEASVASESLMGGSPFDGALIGMLTA